MGELIFDIYCEVEFQPANVSRAEFLKNAEQEMKIQLSEVGKILNFSIDSGEGRIFKTFCKIQVSPDLVIQFEKWGPWEFTRMMEMELKFIFNGFGEIVEFKNGIDYEPFGH